MPTKKSVKPVKRQATKKHLASCECAKCLAAKKSAKKSK